MAEYDNTNKGILSRNERKQADTHPDIKGQINVDGVEYWLDGWKKERKSDGAPFYSLSVKRKDAPAPQPTAAPKRPAFDDSDDAPF